MNIWRLISIHQKDRRREVTRRFADNGRIAVGWGHVGPLGQYDSSDAIGASIRNYYPGSKNSHLGGPSLWNLFTNMRTGDLIIIDAQDPWAQVVEVTGEYEWNDVQPNVATFPDYFHQRAVKRRDDIRSNQLTLITGTQPADGQTPRLVLFGYGSYVRHINI